MIAEATSAPLYAPLADKVGRRPVIVVLLFCWTFGGFAFGLCTSVWAVIVTRAWREYIGVITVTASRSSRRMWRSLADNDRGAV
jgi:MFS family permease